MAAEIKEYKGTPTIILKKDAASQHFFAFGPAKARLIVENFAAIKAFVEANPAKEKTSGIPTITAENFG